MVVLTPVNNNDGKLPVVLLFGAGLVGGAILNKLLSLSLYNARQFIFSWDNANEQLDVLKNVGLFIKESSEVEVIWSAGKAGFFSDRHEINRELQVFKRILGFLDRNISCDKSIRLISSAGGLYEGERVVGKNSGIHPKRSYGELKKSQEEYVSNLDGFKCKTSIRLASVYGYIRKGQRIGLIPTMIKNGLENKETKIFGQLSTLRDYLFIDDIARMFTEIIFMNKNSHEILLLSSNKPTSIMEIIKLIEHAIRKRIYIRFVASKNSEDITYYDNTNPCKAYFTTLNVGIKKVLLDFNSNRLAR
jgi:UDP-glucose 4-epimerase